MIIGLKHGGVDAEERATKDETYEAMKEFANRFIARHGSLICRDLLGCDISTPEGFQLAKKKKLYAVVCPGLVKTAAEIVEEMI